MSWTLFSIITNPDVEAKVAAELEQQGFLATPAQPQARTLEYDGIPKLPYLAAVLNESMRVLTVCPDPTVFG
jgi:cytochrome P450